MKSPPRIIGFDVTGADPKYTIPTIGIKGKRDRIGITIWHVDRLPAGGSDRTLDKEGRLLTNTAKTLEETP